MLTIHKRETDGGVSHASSVYRLGGLLIWPVPVTKGEILFFIKFWFSLTVGQLGKYFDLQHAMFNEEFLSNNSSLWVISKKMGIFWLRQNWSGKNPLQVGCSETFYRQGTFSTSVCRENLEHSAIMFHWRVCNASAGLAVDSWGLRGGGPVLVRGGQC